MALTGGALLAIWHDIDPPMQAEYTEWHTREHMPERVGVPGFTVGKRLVNHALGRHRIGTIYGADTLEVFRSPAYLERLNNPTAWSLRVQPAFRNFLRCACLRLASRGSGDGGAVATVRLDLAEGAGEDGLRAGAEPLAAALLDIPSACCSHVALARADVSEARTRETELRPETNEKPFDALILIEGSGVPELEAVRAEIERTISESACGLVRPVTLVHALAYQLAGLRAGA